MGGNAVGTRCIDIGEAVAGLGSRTKNCVATAVPDPVFGDQLVSIIGTIQ